MSVTTSWQGVWDDVLDTLRSGAPDADSRAKDKLHAFIKNESDTQEYLKQAKNAVASLPIERESATLRSTESETAPQANVAPVHFVSDEAVRALHAQDLAATDAYPPELKPLVDDGRAVYDKGRRGWAVNGRGVTTSNGELNKHGRQLLGLEEAPEPKTQEQTQETMREGWSTTEWWHVFNGFNELEDGGLKMYIRNFIPEGITIITSLPKEGKTWLALSIAKALTTGQPLFGKKGFEVLEQAPVLYLAAEAGDRAFRYRAEKFHITGDKSKFLCRTLTRGMIGLRDPNLEAAIRALKPVVVLDVLSCFSQSDDEDDAVQNQKFRSMINNLRTCGAPVIIVLHHTTKDFKKEPTKEKAVRGTGDILAMVDAVWALMMDDRLEASTGVKEVDVIGWGRDIETHPFRLALTRKTGSKSMTTGFGPGVVSIIDETGDLGWVDQAAVKAAAVQASKDVGDALEQAVVDNPKASIRELAAAVGKGFTFVRDTLTDRGWVRNKSKHAVWRKDE